eukprot:TRINITY_DN1799_c0_g2_i1.p1 TRINITY_DN1799_c0_g2~~TRINITY_DN1799_c0_g2_i1.p1  ORF type:complete len:159 (+),score=42.56 TRINITY_DN1799_c0_g2_i1:69-545(+)
MEDENFNHLEIEPHDGRDITMDALLFASSSRRGFFIDNIIDNDVNTYWKSNGSPSHSIFLHFPSRKQIEQVYLYLNISLDETYTPNVICLRCGDSIEDLKEIATVTINTTNVGWIPLLAKNISAFPIGCVFEICIVSNFDEGRDCVLRQVKLFGSDNF